MAEFQKQLQKDEEVTTQEAQSEEITVYVGSLGAENQKLTIKRGTTLADVVESQGLKNLDIRLNRQAAKGDTILADGDVVIAVPDRIVGGRQGMADAIGIAAMLVCLGILIFGVLSALVR